VEIIVMGHAGSTNGHSRYAGISLHHDAWGRLVLTEAAGRQHTGVEPIRAFPIAEPRRGIALCSAEGRELLWIEDLDELPAPLRHVLEEELARREFVPVIRSILHVSAPVEPSEWEVETDRGRTRFVLNSEDDIYRLDDRRALVTDAHGVRYLILDTGSLDPTSRRYLERYL
jgi:hypothetical protein